MEENGRNLPQKDDEKLTESLKPQLVKAIENQDIETIKLYFKHGWKVDTPLNYLEIAMYPLLMCSAPDFIDSEVEIKAKYIKILKQCSKSHPNMHIADRLGRTCMHHAAAAGNSLGLQFTVTMLQLWFTEKTG